jgi:hypothetical protein
MTRQLSEAELMAQQELERSSEQMRNELTVAAVMSGAPIPITCRVLSTPEGDALLSQLAAGREPDTSSYACDVQVTEWTFVFDPAREP